MGAILTKVVPMVFAKDLNTLYFAAIKNFESNDFTYLIKVDETDRVPSIISHKIDFNNSIDERNSLGRLVALIKEETLKGRIKFGVPFNIDHADNVEYFKVDQYDSISLDIQPAKDYRKTTNQADLLVRSVISHYSVGHGLSSFDSSSRVLFDCGSNSIDYPTYKGVISSEINPTAPNFSIVISHNHSDHFAFVNELHDDYGSKIENIYVSRMFDYVNLKQGVKDKMRKVDIGGKLSHLDMTIYSPSREYSNPNLESLIAVSNGTLMTGDQSYAGIERIFSREGIDKGLLDLICLPHHGRGTSGEPSTLGLDINIDACFSDSNISIGVKETRYYLTRPAKV